MVRIDDRELEPLPMNYFSSYFRKTVYSFYQIVGSNPPDTLQEEYSYLSSHMQHSPYSIVYDYGTYLADHIHEGLVGLQEGNQWVKF